MGKPEKEYFGTQLVKVIKESEAEPVQLKNVGDKLVSILNLSSETAQKKIVENLAK